MASTDMLEAIGLSGEELQERVIERAAQKLAKRVYGEESSELRDAVERIIGETVNKVADEELRPWAEGQIEAVVMQRTNEWGEKRGEPMTFREYLIHRAESYLLELVNYEGKSRVESRDSYGFKESGTRIAHMVDKHLHYHIESAMKAAVAEANSQIAAGIQETVRIKLAEISQALKVEVKAVR